jgi:uncharacterized protein YbaR (Trm112 family)
MEATPGRCRERSVPATAASAGWARLSGMPIDPELLEILACPLCQTPVEVVKDGAGLRCAKCRRVYPVQDDIPVMLVDEATIEE